MAVQHIDTGDTRRMIAQFHANMAAIDVARPSLLAQHEGEWVASYDGSFVFGGSIEDAVAAAETRGWPLAVTAVKQVLRQRDAILL